MPPSSVIGYSEDEGYITLLIFKFSNIQVYSSSICDEEKFENDKKIIKDNTSDFIM
ncbi:hypothetical protein [uncultured Algibacter sp.]|uniref:hypothetical protein n=1 Tax=uncultured Algibacter sp. TaxID=298659 RepID=UPI00262657B6|nr:hypothetical protein [uncultured Algibacter sp.]